MMILEFLSHYLMPISAVLIACAVIWTSERETRRYDAEHGTGDATSRGRQI